MRINEIINREEVVDETPASRDLCTSGKPNSALGASNLASCVAQGLRARSGGGSKKTGRKAKSQKIGSERVSLPGKKLKSTAYGGPISPTRTG